MVKYKKQKREYDKKRKIEVQQYNSIKKNNDQSPRNTLQCVKCFKIKDKREFIDNRIKNKTCFTSHCQICRTAFKLVNVKCYGGRKFLIKKTIDDAKIKSGGCMITGCDAIHEVLQMGHIEASKKCFNLNVPDCKQLFTKLISNEQVITTLNDEIAKCVVICRFHHNIKSQLKSYERGQQARLGDDTGSRKNQLDRRSLRKRTHIRREHVIMRKIEIGGVLIANVIRV